MWRIYIIYVYIYIYIHCTDIRIHHGFQWILRQLSKLWSDRINNNSDLNDHGRCHAFLTGPHGWPMDGPWSSLSGLTQAAWLDGTLLKSASMVTSFSVGSSQSGDFSPNNMRRLSNYSYKIGDFMQNGFKFSQKNSCIPGIPGNGHLRKW